MKFEHLINEENIIKHRRYLHENPELSFFEVNTAKYIQQELEKIGHLQISFPTKTSVLAVLDTNIKGETILLRADIDALPILEEANVSFKSKNPGIMHACGHDAHTAMLLGACETIVSLRDKLKGRVIFIFQHAEEKLPGGAAEICKTGVLKNIDYVYGIHVAPLVPTGIVCSKPGYLTAACDEFNITLIGRGGHGAIPQETVDLSIVIANFINSIQSVVSRNTDPMESLVITIGEILMGSANNVICDSATMRGTIRTFSKEIRKLAEERLKTILNGLEVMYDINIKLEFVHGYSAVNNNQEAYINVVNAAKKVVGEECYMDMPALMGSEDFSAYTDLYKGAFFVVGISSTEDTKVTVHHPKFKIDESMLKIGTMMHIQLIIDHLSNENTLT